MKFIFTAAALLLASGLLLAQATKKVTFKNETPEYKEVYYVLEDQSEIKHGEYKKSYAGSNLIEEGHYENNIRTGIWEFKSKNGLEQRIDFSNNIVLFAKENKALVGSIIVEGENRKENKSGKLPILLGGEIKLKQILWREMRYPADARRSGIQGSVIVSALITKEGLMIDEMIEQGPGYGLNEEALRVIKLIPDDWLPLKINGEAVDTRVFIELKFLLG